MKLKIFSVMSAGLFMLLMATPALTATKEERDACLEREGTTISIAACDAVWSDETLTDAERAKVKKQYLDSIAAQRRIAPDVTFEELLREQLRYDDKVVRIRGQVTNCAAWTCDLCPEEITQEEYVSHSSEKAKQCLGIYFDGYEIGGSARSVSSLMEQSFRFATVTVTAYFSRTCLGDRLIRTPEEEKVLKEKGIETICMDRVSQLTAARVEQTHSRKNAADGLVSRDGWIGKLIPAAKADGEAMMSLNPSALYDNDDYPVRAYQVEGQPDTGILCECYEEECTGKWPTRWFMGFESPANPFVCYSFQKRKGKWLRGD